jgi:hypothetical protein
MIRMIRTECLRDARDVSPSNAVAALRAYELGTVDGIAGATRMFEQEMPDFERPSAHGFGVLKASGAVVAEVMNGSGHDLPAMLLAAICGYRRGTQAVALSAEQLQLAITAMAPAEKCAAYKHPNISAWRRVLRDLQIGDTSIAVFVGRERSSSAQAPGNSLVQMFLAGAGHNHEEVNRAT